MRTSKNLEELRHSIDDVLDVASLSDTQMVQTLLRKVNGGATMKQVLTAALSVARERQNERIAELELEDAESDHPELEAELRHLRNKLAKYEKTEGQS